jgi:hypothetical protein
MQTVVICSQKHGMPMLLLLVLLEWYVALFSCAVILLRNLFHKLSASGTMRFNNKRPLLANTPISG